MANKPGKPGNFFYILFVGVPVSAMLLYGIYIYYYHDYGSFVSPEYHKNEQSSGSINPNDTVPSVPIQAPVAKVAAILQLMQSTLSIPEVADAHKLLQAELLITNEGATNVRILYTPWPSSLVEPQIDYLGPDGKAKPVRLEFPKDAIPPVPPHDPRAPKPIRFIMADLNPGEKLSIPVNLNPPFDLSRPGKYSLQVQYDPTTFCRQMALNAIALRIYGYPLHTPPIEFEVVGAKPPLAEKSSSAEEPAKSAAAP